MSLDIFPAGGLASSVITAVWVGVFVVVMLNLRFGTTLSGLVIPGYLVPLLFIKPISAGVVIVESIITYLVTLFVAKIVMTRFGYSELFGRDRFFALVVVSVIVRIIFDYLLLPQVGEWAIEQGFNFDYQNHLQSFGLIIVALIANQMWNSGLKSGSKILFLYIALTYLIIKYLLVPFTNFNIAEIGYMYENLAQSLLASPKAYIILITTAFVASRMNLFYGWEFNGILIPSLLALQWYQPEKLLFTFVETLIILALGHAVTRLSVFKHISFEGSRLFLLFFNVAFLYKIVLGFFLIEFFPTFKITDFYGFGYLISTLLAMKMYQKDIAVHMTRATVQTSFIAVVIASVIGFALTFTPQWQEQELKTVERARASMQKDSLSQFYTNYRPQLFEANFVSYTPPTANEQHIFEEAIEQLTESPSDVKFLNASELLNKIGFDLYLVEEKYWLITDQQPQRGWGIYVINTAATNELVIQAPDPLTERHTDLAGLKLFEHFQAKALAISSSKRKRAGNGMADVLAFPGTIYQIFSEQVSDNNTLQLRAYTSELNRQITGQRTFDIDTLSQSNILWAKRQLPADLPLKSIETWLRQLDVRFTPPPFENIQRSQHELGFAELILTSNAIKRLMADIQPLNASKEIQTDQQFVGFLQSWLRENKSMIAKRASYDYQPPKLSELLFWDEELLKPLLLLAENYQMEQWSSENLDELNRLATIASAYQYTVTRYIEENQQQEYLMLAEVPSDNMRHWGTLIIRLGDASDYLLEVPHPLFEASTFEFANSWFAHLNARYLLIAGSHPYANPNEIANVSKFGNAQTLFQLTHQAIVRFEQDENLLPVQIRSFNHQSGRATPKEQVLLNFWQSIGVPTSPSTAQLLHEQLNLSGLSIALADGSRENSSFDAGHSHQSTYASMVDNSSFATIRISPELQYRYKEKGVNSAIAQQARALSLPSLSVDLKTWLAQQPKTDKKLSDDLLALINVYQSKQDIITLQNILKHSDIEEIAHVKDIDSGQSFLLIYDHQKRWQALVNPYALGAKDHFWQTNEDVIKFINLRDSVLLVNEQ